MSEYGNCNLCGEELVLSGARIVGGVNYSILECQKCRRQIIRSD